jgi:hypothetical protein
MNRRPVNSSNVVSVGWEPAAQGADTGTLEVEFKSGGLYRYGEVPETVYEELIGASSPGRYLAQNVIGTYDANRV